MRGDKKWGNQVFDQDAFSTLLGKQDFFFFFCMAGDCYMQNGLGLGKLPYTLNKDYISTLWIRCQLEKAN